MKRGGIIIENFAKLPKVLCEKFERAKPCFHDCCKFCKTIYSNFSIGLFVLSILLIASVSAEIFIDELRSVYNIGDSIDANVTLSSSIDTAGFFHAYLVCGANEIETYKSIEVINTGEQKRIHAVAILDNQIIGNTEGGCYIRALYGSGEARSQPFSISRIINIEVSTEGAVYSPEDNVGISGKVIKDNREPLNGIVNVVIEGVDVKKPAIPIVVSNESTSNSATESNETTSENQNETAPQTTQEIIDSILQAQGVAAPQAEGPLIIGSFSAEVVDGQFSASFPIPKNSPPGTYKITASAFDVDRNGAIMNKGESSTTIKVNQVINNLDLKFDADTVTPGNDFVYTAILYDQAGNEGEGEVIVNIRKPDKSLILEKIVKAGQPISFFIQANSTPGFWEVKASMESFEKAKTFYVEELRQISTNVSSGILTIVNIGNIGFKGPIEVSIGNKTSVTQIDLDVGENQELKLGAPDGEYEISVSDGKSTQSLGKTFLTGNVIGINNSSFSWGKMSTWLWALGIAILIVIVLILIRRVMKKKSFGKIPKSVGGNVSQPAMYSRKESPVISGISNLTDHGEKQEAAIIAMKIKDTGDSRMSSESIENALMKAKNARAKIYVDKDYRIIVFVPSITKSKDNDIIALNVAKEMESTLKNADTSGKLSWGIGVHYGQMAVESHEGNIKFVSLENTIAIAKRVAENSRGSVLLSEQIHKRTLGKAKADKLEGTNFWQLKRIINREYYEDFLKRFLNRQKK